MSRPRFQLFSASSREFGSRPSPLTQIARICLGTRLALDNQSNYIRAMLTMSSDIHNAGTRNAKHNLMVPKVRTGKSDTRSVAFSRVG